MHNNLFRRKWLTAKDTCILWWGIGEDKNKEREAEQQGKQQVNIASSNTSHLYSVEFISKAFSKNQGTSTQSGVIKIDLFFHIPKMPQRLLWIHICFRWIFLKFSNRITLAWNWGLLFMLKCLLYYCTNVSKLHGNWMLWQGHMDCQYICVGSCLLVLILHVLVHPFMITAFFFLSFIFFDCSFCRLLCVPLSILHHFVFILHL